jgi:uncharacterized protein
MSRRELAKEIRSRLEFVHGERLRGVVLYGSEARGDARPDSDIDVLVLLDGPIELGKDLHTSIKALYPLVLELERPIHPVPTDVLNYEAGVIALYRIARDEGISA